MDFFKSFASLKVSISPASPPLSLYQQILNWLSNPYGQKWILAVAAGALVGFLYLRQTASRPPLKSAPDTTPKPPTAGVAEQHHSHTPKDFSKNMRNTLEREKNLEKEKQQLNLPCVLDEEDHLKEALKSHMKKKKTDAEKKKEKELEKEKWTEWLKRMASLKRKQSKIEDDDGADVVSAGQSPNATVQYGTTVFHPDE